METQDPSHSKLHPVSVCILGADRRPAILKAIQTVRDFGVEVHVAVAEQREELEDIDGVHQHLIQWENDFAAARNSLLSQVDSEFVLWIDSDEILLSFSEIDWSDLQGDLHAVRICDEANLTAAMRVRCHRNNGNVSWVGAIHEQLRSTSGDDDSPRTLPGILVLHEGYEDPLLYPEKYQRNLSIAQQQIDKGEASHGAMTVLASSGGGDRSEENVQRWLQCFEHPDVRPSNYVDRRHVAAGVLCELGHPEPALTVLSRNPLIVSLQLAVLADGLRSTGEVDEDRLCFLEKVLQHAAFDQNYAFPTELLGQNRDGIMNYLTQMVKDWTVDESEPEASFGPDTQFARSDRIEEEEFDGDRVLLHMDTRKVIVLNPTAAVIWQALAWRVTRKDLSDLLAEAHPGSDAGELEEALSQTLALLHSESFLEICDSGE